MSNSSAHPINIAIAEDQVLFRECFVSQFRDIENISVRLEASNGKQLLDQLQQTSWLPDIVLLDLNMPVMNGLETTKQLKNHYPYLKIIILSVHILPKYIGALVDEGVNGYLAKNSPLSEVKEAIQCVHKNGFYFSLEVLRGVQAGTLNKEQQLPAFGSLEILTTREKEVLVLICQEFTATEIAEKLYLSKRTVDGHRNNLLIKTGCRNTAGLVIFAVKNQLVDANLLNDFK